MYPQPELTRLDVHKTTLRRRIRNRRTTSAVDAIRAAQPVVWIDGAVGLWRRFAPLAGVVAVPLVLLLKRSRASRRAASVLSPRFVRKLVHWAPFVLAVIRRLGPPRRPGQ